MQFENEIDTTGELVVATRIVLTNDVHMSLQDVVQYTEGVRLVQIDRNDVTFQELTYLSAASFD